MGHVHPCSIAHCYINSRHTHRTPQDILALSDPDTFGPGPTHPQVSFQSGEPERSSMIHIHIHIYIYISIYPYIYISIYLYLVGGFKHEFYIFHFICGIILTHWRTHIFQDGYRTTNQISISISLSISLSISPLVNVYKKKTENPHCSWVNQRVYIYIYT